MYRLKVRRADILLRCHGFLRIPRMPTLVAESLIDSIVDNVDGGHDDAETWYVVRPGEEYQIQEEIDEYGEAS